MSLQALSLSREPARRVAMGEIAADTALINARVIHVTTGEISAPVTVAISGGRIAGVGDCAYTIGPQTKIIDVAGRFVVPGLIDGHMHVESAMMTVSAFSNAVLPYGTTAVFMDPHEIANVLGWEGLRLFYDEGYHTPVKVFTTIPSCIPAAPGLEDASTTFTAEQIDTALDWSEVPGLSEVMNFSGVVSGDPFYRAIISSTLRRRLIPTGHLPTRDLRQIMAYAAAGVNSDHQYSGREAALNKLRLGLTVMIREASASKDIRDVIRIVTEDHVATRNILLVTDDVDPITIRDSGHLNHVVRRAIQEGVDPVIAIQMATINPATYFHYEHELGSVTPGKIADLLVIPRLPEMVPDLVITDGQVAAHDQTLCSQAPPFSYPDWAAHSIHLGRTWEPSDFHFYSRSANKPMARIRAIQLQPNSTVTLEATLSVPIVEGEIQPNANQDVALLASIERHHGTKQYALGFVQGFGLKHGAVASSIAHDSHNVLVMGTNPGDMAVAVQALANCGGGLVVVNHGEILSLVRLPIAGLVINAEVNDLAQQLDALQEAWRTIGSRIPTPYMTFASLALPVIPHLRLTNRGLVDVNAGKIVPVELTESDAWIPISTP